METSGADVSAWKAKLAAQFPFLAKLLGGGASAGKASEDATDANIKVPVANTSAEKRQKIIRVVLILGALYAGYDFLMTEEEPVVPVLRPVARPKKDKKIKEAVDKVASETFGESNKGPDAPVEGATPPAEDTTTSAPADSLPADTDTAASAPIEAKEGNTPEPAEIEAAADADLNKVDLGLSTQDPFTEGESAVKDQVAEEPKVEEGSGDMTQQILKDLEKQIDGEKPQTGEPTERKVSTYIAPPDYELIGRGLVYNCSGKHWACIDGPSFKICQQNHASLKDQGKTRECYPDSVYQSNSDCAWIQREKITGNVKVDCN